LAACRRAEHELYCRSVLTEDAQVAGC
jgi:hypothetical protein